jgi:hypothetical protein
MENNTKKPNAKSFRSVALDGTLCKTFVILFKEEQCVTIVQRYLFIEQKENFKLLRKYKHYYYCEKWLAFKINSFYRVVECFIELQEINNYEKINNT